MSVVGKRKGSISSSRSALGNSGYDARDMNGPRDVNVPRNLDCAEFAKLLSSYVVKELQQQGLVRRVEVCHRCRESRNNHWNADFKIRSKQKNEPPLRLPEKKRTRHHRYSFLPDYHTVFDDVPDDLSSPKNSKRFVENVHSEGHAGSFRRRNQHRELDQDHRSYSLGSANDGVLSSDENPFKKKRPTDTGMPRNPSTSPTPQRIARDRYYPR